VDVIHRDTSHVSQLQFHYNLFLKSIQNIVLELRNARF
jgi:hypothetical protein